MLARIRENLLLKVISLIAAILLWVYVQAEKPANAVRSMLATVVTQNAPDDLDIKNIPQQVPVSAIGPPAIIERLKDGDIQAIFNLKNIRAERASSVMLRAAIVIPEFARGVAVDPPAPIRIQVNPQQQSQMAIVPLYPKEPPAGFHYGKPDVRPRFAMITGLADKINKVDRLVVLAAPPEPGASIDGDFPVLIHDSDNNPVEDVRVDPDKVHITVPLIEEPAAKIVAVSASVSDQVPLPYTLQSITTKPVQVKITGRPDRLNAVDVLRTEDISLRKITQDQTMDVSLVIPPNITVHDLSGKRITSVAVTISVHKNSVPAPVVAPTTPAVPPTEPPP